MGQNTKVLADIFAFNSILVPLGISDLKNEDAIRRMRGGEGSSISWMVGHMASARYGILQILGVTEDNPFDEMWPRGGGATDGSEYPPIEELVVAWEEVSRLLHDALSALSDEDALKDSPSETPIPDKSIRGTLGFLAWHESNHMGQLGLMRTEFGYQAIQFRYYDFLESQGEG